MDTKYIYSSNKVKAMEDTLLSDPQVERLLSAKDHTQAFQSLNDTFLSPYVTTEEKTSLPKALRQSLIDTKKELASIAPEPRLLDILWFRYDFYNLKTIIKGIRAGLEREEVLERCYDIGSVDIKDMFDAVNEERLGMLEKEFGDAYRNAVSAPQVYEIDIAMHKGYFSLIKRIADMSRNAFIRKFVTLLIDIFNIKTSLRVLALPDMSEKLFIEGGSVREDDLQTKESVLESLKGIGGESVWKEAIEQYQRYGHYSLLEKTSDDYIVSFLKNESRDIFSIATLFAFFAARRNNVQVVKTIMTAKDADMDESELRIILRRLYG